MSVKVNRRLWLTLAIASGAGIAWQTGMAAAGGMNPLLFGLACLMFFVSAPVSVYFLRLKVDALTQEEMLVEIEQAKIDAAKEHINGE